jgi:hypothetical protein
LGVLNLLTMGNRATTKTSVLVGLGFAAMLGSVLLSGCAKESAPPPAPSVRVTDAALRQRVLDKVAVLPSIGVYNRRMNKVIVFRPTSDGSREFNFIDPPGSGIDFASSNGGQWTWSESEGMMILTEPSSGLGAGGGTVVAGNASLEIDLAVCFSVDEEAMGADLFDTGVGEVAGVIGISGDFEALANGDFSENEDDIFDYFHGFAYYLVYADELENSDYEVLNWVDDLDQPEEDLEDFGFSFVVSFQNEGGIYISQDGTLNVNGGSIGFNGNYYAIEGVGFFDDEGDDDADLSVVPGFGTMGCN